MDWYKCKFLESAANLKPLVHARMGRMPSTAVAQDIAACLQQGRLFYEAAVSSPLEIRPLQQFYGMVGFAKAVTIARRVTSLSTLPHSHGIEDRSAKGAKIADLRLTIADTQRGTFQEANDATRNLNRYCYFGEAFKPMARYSASAASPELAGVSISLKDLLSRVPNLANHFTETFGEPSNTEPLTTIDNPGKCLLRIDDKELYENLAGLRRIVERWRLRFPFLRSWAVQSAEHGWGNSIIQFTNVTAHPDEFQNGPFVFDKCTYNFGISDADTYFDYLGSLPPLGGGFAAGVPWAIAPYEGLYLSEFSVHYLTLFLLSTLVRYTPQTWMHAITRSFAADSTPDDQALALIEQFLDVNSSFTPDFIAAVLNPRNDRADTGQLPVIS